jgi:uncharacterized protein (TIGR02145 family)
MIQITQFCFYCSFRNFLVFMIICMFLNPLKIISQSTQKFKYDLVLRDNDGQIINNQQVGLKAEIIKDNPEGLTVFMESHLASTNSNGRLSLEIGNGIVGYGSLSSINWADGPYYLKIEIDPLGFNNYTIISINQLLSVPYALYARAAGNSIPGPQGPQGPIGNAGIDGENGLNGLNAYQIWLNAGNNGSEVEFLNSLNGMDGDPSSDNQVLSVSQTGDTLFIENGGYVIIPGISAANYDYFQSGISTHSCGATNVHNINVEYGSVSDQDGNLYRTVLIGEQEWMAENLKTNIFRNGDLIQYSASNVEWQSLSNTLQGAWCYYNNDSAFNCPYGKLYNWYTVSDPRNLCPNGWHVPTDIDWTLLTDYLGGTSIAGGKIKSEGTTYWNSPNVNADNQSGFSGLAAKYRNLDGTFGNLIFYGSVWWSSSDILSTTQAWTRSLSSATGEVSRINFYKNYGFSVRCLRD